ncbi:hypothetical protein [Streptomyces sp. NPDC127108]|uniref:hypothetical protein n=1 Tax=Streptomyces sp. NPDC127108 TaxID=3345361 RepID=UPI00363FD858
MKLNMRRHAVTASVAAAFLVGGLATATPASAGGNYSCGNWKMKVNNWSATCTVKSGQARAVTDCSNGKTIYGKWVGRGTWGFGGNCGQYFIVAHTTQGRG